jgi:eukaryotic-like serine/threonine-protein kinase
VQLTPFGVARSSAEGRPLLQSRLKRFAGLGASIGLGLLVAGAAIGPLRHLPGSLAIALVLAGAVVVGAGAWGYARAGRRRMRALLAIDVLSTSSHCAPFVALAWTLPLSTRPELVALLGIGQVLALRAYWVPSSGRRTLALGSVPLAAAIASTVLRYGRGGPDAPGWLAISALACVFSLGIALVTTLTSRTIVGLRRRVREASQLGQYTLTEKIGEGGMGVVYKARHATLRRPTAIKLLPPERAGEHNLVRFEREVQLTSQLTHPNTVAIYDYGRSYDGVLYYAMEYLDGTDLESVVQFAGPQAPARVAHVLMQICAALEEAHAAGLIHRDIKPQNVMLCRRGGVADVAKVVDFGLVKELARPGRSDQSLAEQVVGTPLYMSPEAISQPALVDARSDLYAVGALGYFMLTGTPPFPGTSHIEVCAHHVFSTPERPSVRLGRALPAELERVILACLAKAQDERPESARVLADSIARCELARWTRGEANAWWHEHGGALAERRRAANLWRAGSNPLRPKTLAIDLTGRAPLIRAWQSTPPPSPAPPRDEAG